MDASARFDDATTGGSFTLDGADAEFVARTPGEVVAVLHAAEAAAEGGGAWVAGWVSYEAAPGLDAALPVRAGPAGGPPLAWFGRFRRRLDTAPEMGEGAPDVGWMLDTTEAEHRAQVAEVRGLIAAGVTYQVNLTARAHAHVDDVESLYSSLVAGQGGAYGALIVSPTHAVACASPELFFARDGASIETRPMKGTVRRGRWAGEDDAREHHLRTSGKERAENLMIVDLIRNDVGRVAEYGSVHVPALFETERYPTVWQMTSTVRGRLRPGTSLADVFTALFPSGSVTGAPKRSAMHAIARLEPARGVYCGAVGYIERGRARFAVAIRTATVDRSTGAAEYGTGGGITWSSDAPAEWRELVAKTAILRRPPRIDGLFETLRSDGEAGERHLDRMAASAQFLNIPFDRAEGRRLLERHRAPPGRLRLDLARDGRMWVTCSPLPDLRPVRLAWAEEPVDSGDVRLFHKTWDREPYDRRRATTPGADDVILVNERGEVTETTTANVAVRIEGRWWTPPVDCGLLAGVERARLIADETLAERVIHREEVREVAVVNSLRGWRPATLIS